LAFARHWRRTSGALRQASDKKINYAAGNRQGLATGKKNIPVKIASPATGPKPYFEHWLQPFGLIDASLWSSPRAHQVMKTEMVAVSLPRSYVSQYQVLHPFDLSVCWEKPGGQSLEKCLKTLRETAT
jgi:hypothetical protein